MTLIRPGLFEVIFRMVKETGQIFYIAISLCLILQSGKPQAEIINVTK